MSDSTFRPVVGGIDLGGTKIEATLFDAELLAGPSRRIATPRDSYERLHAALLEEIRWLRATAKNPDLPVGIGLPGLIDPVAKVSVTANLPAGGRTLATDIQSAAGGRIALVNDCKAFALSEANGGGGAGFDSVFGLILGTGLGGGFCRNGNLILGANGLTGEIGHYGLPAHLMAKLDLPILQCGCGRMGCFETLVSGTGLSRLARHLAGREASGEEIVAASSDGDADMARVLDVFVRLAAELIHAIQLHLDPECIVLGGGLSRIEGLDRMFGHALGQALLPSVRPPEIRKPKFGDSSGGRGAALFALSQKEARS